MVLADSSNFTTTFPTKLLNTEKAHI